MNTRILPALLLLGVVACGDAPLDPAADVAVPDAPVALGKIDVSSPADAGPGSFRAAVEAANEDPSIDRIVLDGSATISLEETVTFTGGQDLVVEGRGATLDFSGTTSLADGLVTTGGGDLTLRNLTVAGAAGNGVLVSVPGDASGTLEVVLHEVTIRGAGLHGLHIDDQTNDSPATIRLVARGVKILENGFDPDNSDFDGIRVDEGGEGDLLVDIRRMTVEGNAGDGNEYDERGPGDVVASVNHSTFDNNGSQPQDPEDLEDGFDIDEAGQGGIYATFNHVSASRTFDEGIDLDEDGDGDVVARLNHVVANGNLDENIKITEGEADIAVDEEGDILEDEDGQPVLAGPSTSGGVFVRLNQVTANGSQDGDGVKFEEFGDGDFEGLLTRVEIRENWSDGLEIEQWNAGSGYVKIRASRIRDNDVEMDGNDDIDVDGVEVDLKEAGRRR